MKFAGICELWIQISEKNTKRLLWSKALKSRTRHGHHFVSDAAAALGPQCWQCTSHSSHPWERGALCMSTAEQVGDCAIFIRLNDI